MTPSIYSRTHGTLAPTVPWPGAVADFLLQVRGTREANTEQFYRQRLGGLMRWASEQNVSLTDFKARHLREYLAYRSIGDISDMARRHDACY